GNITGAVAKPPGLPRLRLIRAPLSRCSPGKRSATGEYHRRRRETSRITAPAPDPGAPLPM
ncbi:hypothetical protein, partial [Raoultella ornithinolytica]|uniref:hypothetical protein n=1 Tax=Raoultella ornithinolytica TaxID=54291 RepID=UPI00301BF02B